MEMAIHEVEEGCVIFWSVRMAAFAISPANGVWFAEEIVDFLGRSRSSISTCGVRAMIFIGFCEQQSARGYECVQVVIVVGQFGIAIFMGRIVSILSVLPLSVRSKVKSQVQTWLR